ncbi:hypothetical protein [Streptomyces sp. S186]|uniref:hypothetical protein n=1 Tax=Streptomyces sp. S186 TaxID=3434395 RepID=UPI003F66A2C7
MSLIINSYELSDRQRLVSTILWWQDLLARHQSQADAGDVAMVRLRDAGAVRQVQGAYQWVSDHRTALERSVR